MTDCRVLKPVTRAGLVGAVGIGIVILDTPPTEKMVIIILPVLAAVAAAVLVIRGQSGTDDSRSTWNQPISRIQVGQTQVSEYQ